MFLSECREFPSAPCLARKKNLTSRVSMLLKSRASLICFRASFLPGPANDLSVSRVQTERKFGSGDLRNVEKNIGQENKRNLFEADCTLCV